MLRRLPPTLKRASCTDSSYNDSRQLEWPGLLQRCALESDHLWNVIPTIIFTVGAMAVFSELYHYLPNSCTCIGIQWKWFWVVQQVCRRVNVCQLWVCPHLHVISGISRPFFEQADKIVNFMQILQHKDDFVNRLGKMEGWCLNAKRELALFMFSWYKCLLRLAGCCR